MPTVEDINPTPSGHCQPGCVRLSAYLRGRFNLGDSGCYNPNSRLGSGAPSYHVHGQAIDLTANWHDSSEQVRGNLAFQWAFEHANELNLQEAIFGHRIVTSRRWNEGIRFYPPTDHENHCHIAVGEACSQDWHAPGMAPTLEDDDMYTDADRARAAHIESMLGDGAAPGVLADVNRMLHKIVDVIPGDPNSGAIVRVAGIEKMLGAWRDGITGLVSVKPGDTLPLLKDGASKLIEAAQKIIG